MIHLLTFKRSTQGEDGLVHQTIDLNDVQKTLSTPYTCWQFGRHVQGQLIDSYACVFKHSRQRSKREYPGQPNSWKTHTHIWQGGESARYACAPNKYRATAIQKMTFLPFCRLVWRHFSSSSALSVWKKPAPTALHTLIRSQISTDFISGHFDCSFTFDLLNTCSLFLAKTSAITSFTAAVFHLLFSFTQFPSLPRNSNGELMNHRVLV